MKRRDGRGDDRKKSTCIYYGHSQTCNYQKELFPCVDVIHRYMYIHADAFVHTVLTWLAL